ncbi:MAG: DUF2029 domain-containing protein [Methylotenera sp.]|nr:DUF2029 domain-containing protein [Oligoflexia bacterium]
MKIAAVLSAVLLVFVGIFWAFQRGSPDFSVFYEAWRLVLSGHGPAIFGGTPDRYLYAPGFAWILSPLGFFSRPVALALWCLAKATGLALVIRYLHRSFFSTVSLAAGCLALLFIARPLLIDFQYGQVNLFILCACLWALLNHFDSRASRAHSFLAWLVLGVAAVVKIFPIPLVVVPWFLATGLDAKKLRSEKMGVIAGVLLVTLIPLLSVNFDSFLELYSHWKSALLSRGFPLESHNQSFAALVHHYTSGEDTHVIFLGSKWIPLGSNVMSEATRTLLNFSWTLCWLGVLAAWIVNGARVAADGVVAGSAIRLKWLAVSVALLIVPSHLVWKPYFIFSYPLIVCLLIHARRSRAAWVLLGVFFFLMNLTSFDFLGGWWSARFEAASVFLIAHLIALLHVMKKAQPPAEAAGAAV